MTLHLVGDDRRVEPVVRLREQLPVEVRHADVVGHALVGQLLEGVECPLGVVRRHRPVDVQQVDAVDPQPVERIVGGAFRVLVREIVREDLRRQKHLLAGHVCPLDPGTHRPFVLVHLCRVDVTVPQLQRTTHCLGTLLEPTDVHGPQPG